MGFGHAKPGTQTRNSEITWCIKLKVSCQNRNRFRSRFRPRFRQ